MNLHSISAALLFFSTCVTKPLQVRDTAPLETLPPLPDISHTTAANPQENLPWYLTNIRVFEPADSTTQASASISFVIEDRNPGLEFSTSCSYYTQWGVLSAATPGEGYVACLNGNVRFRYDGVNIGVERGWFAPDNSSSTGLDYSLCFGEWETSMHSFASSNPKGVVKKQGCMEVYCTRQCEFSSELCRVMTDCFSYVMVDCLGR